MALILVFRPKEMVAFERKHGHDHGLKVSLASMQIDIPIFEFIMVVSV